MHPDFFVLVGPGRFVNRGAKVSQACKPGFRREDECVNSFFVCKVPSKRTSACLQAPCRAEQSRALSCSLVVQVAHEFQVILLAVSSRQRCPGLAIDLRSHFCAGTQPSLANAMSASLPTVVLDQSRQNSAAQLV